MKKTLPILLLATLLAGCSGSGDSADATSVAGVWQGMIEQQDGPIVNDVSCLIAVDGRMICVLFNPANGDIAGLTTGTASTDGDTFHASGTAYAAPGYVLANGSTTGTGAVGGTFVERQSIDLTADVAGGGFVGALIFDPAYDRGSSLGNVAGVYQDFSVAGETSSLSIDENGAIFATSTSGCVGSGGISVIDPDYNAYSVTLTVEACGELNGVYNGLAMTADDQAENDVLVVAVFGATGAIIGVPVK